jgi:hypothetical protein
MKTMNYHRKKFFFFPLAIAGVALFTYVTMFLWNVLLPEIFNISTITFWQALGLLALTRLLFGGMHSNWKRHRTFGHHDSEFRKKMMNMSSEEKKEFFRKMHYERSVWHRSHSKENCGEHDHTNAEQHKTEN